MRVKEIQEAAGRIVTIFSRPRPIDAHDVGFDGFENSIAIHCLIVKRHPLYPLTQKGPASPPPARLRHHSACAISIRLRRCPASLVILTPPVHGPPEFLVSGSSAHLKFAAAGDQTRSDNCDMRILGPLPWNGDWSAGRTARPRGNPRPCKRRTTASRLSSHHPRAGNADVVSHTFAKS